MKNVLKYIEIIKETMKELFDEKNIGDIEINVNWQEIKYKGRA